MTAKENKRIRCAKCLYEWIPRIEPSQIRECPSCKSRYWNDRATEGALSNKAFMEVVNTPFEKRKYVPEESIGSKRNRR